MYVNEIYSAACAICDDEGELLKLLAAAAEEELEFKLKKDADISDFPQLFIASAALLAASMYLGAKPENGFRAGSLSVNGKTADPGDMAKRAELMLSGYLRNDGFAFTGVET